MEEFLTGLSLNGFETVKDSAMQFVDETLGFVVL